MSITGTVFDIQHFTIHDGPGIRTELFLKGCTQRCLWCSNPEGRQPQILPGVFQKKCLGKKACGLCLEACPSGSLRFYRNRLTGIDRESCVRCMACAEVCPAEAVRPWGREMTAEAAMEEIRKDRGYYERSGGGVTLSGGEPLLQPEFAAELLAGCQREGIHTCCESGLCVGWDAVERLLPVTDLWIADLKMMDPQAHRQWTGQSNETILDNLRRLAAAGADLILRVPVIPGVNDAQENMARSADFILEELHGNIRTLQLLSFMRLGQEKYASLGLPYEMADVLKQARFRRDHFQKKIEGFAAYFNSRGIHTLVGTREKP